VLPDGTACVLKVSPHVDETRQEISALALWNGDGAARLLAADPDVGVILLERIEPGTMLVELAREDDDAATHVAASIFATLWQSAPGDSGLRSLESWCAAFDRNRPAMSSGAAGFPKPLFQRADALRSDLLASPAEPVSRLRRASGAPYVD
jgi:streptomycin 6-kinase